ncbi:MAG TPA: histone deacetylase [Bryobacteraceae bacterium]|nr:histone deacetylase [Bryobacteraceae bacterium]
MKRVWYCDHHPLPLPPGHRFPAEKYELVRRMLAPSDAFEFTPAAAADPELIASIHERSYVLQVLEGAVPAAVMRRIGFPWSEGLVRRTMASVGGTLQATAEALETGWGGNLAGGTHHAFRDAGAGFCVFNDIAIAFEVNRAAGRIRRAAILDLDVHQGDGTAAIFGGDPDVLTISIHSQNNFPFHKQRSSIDIGLPDEVGDEAFLNALASVLPLIRDFRPDIVFYQSGVDGLAEDRLGRLALTHNGLAERDRTVFEFARRIGAPIVVTMGGGYGEPIESTAQAHANTFRTASEVFSGSIAGERPSL